MQDTQSSMSYKLKQFLVQRPTYFQRSCNIDFTGMADTPCRRSPFAMNFSEVTVSSAGCTGDYHRSLSFPWFATAFSVCSNAH